jgi:hypothetical protein
MIVLESMPIRIYIFQRLLEGQNTPSVAVFTSFRNMAIMKLDKFIIMLYGKVSACPYAN